MLWGREWAVGRGVAVAGLRWRWRGGAGCVCAAFRSVLRRGGRCPCCRRGLVQSMDRLSCPLLCKTGVMVQTVQPAEFRSCSSWPRCCHAHCCDVRCMVVQFSDKVDMPVVATTGAFGFQENCGGSAVAVLGRCLLAQFIDGCGCPCDHAETFFACGSWTRSSSCPLRADSAGVQTCRKM